MLLADPQPAMRPSGAQAASGAYTRQTRAVIGMVALGREVTEPSVGEEVGFEAVLGRVPRWPG